MVDLAGRDTVHIGLHDHAEQRLLASFAGLQEAREVALTRALSGHRQLDLADPCRPGPLPVAVAVSAPGLRNLALAGADLAGDLGLHDLRGDHRHALAQEVGMLLDQRLGYDPGARHALVLGHRGVPFVSRLAGQPTSLGPAVAGTSSRRFRGAASGHCGPVTPLLATRPDAGLCPPIRLLPGAAKWPGGKPQVPLGLGRGGVSFRDQKSHREPQPRL